MKKENVIVWYDKKADFLEVIFEKKKGWFEDTLYDALSVRVDSDKNIIGFSILGLSGLNRPMHCKLNTSQKQICIDYDVGADVLYVSFQNPPYSVNHEEDENGIVWNFNEKGELTGITVIIAKRSVSSLSPEQRKHFEESMKRNESLMKKLSEM